MDKDLMKKISEKIEGYRDEMVALQSKLTAIPALGPTNDGEGEEKKAAFIKEWMAKEVGFDELEQHDSPDARVPSGSRPNIVAIVKGTSDAKRIWVMAHTDIVPPGEPSLWNSDPYTVKVEDGKVYGRGVEDNQHGMVTPLFALKALKELGIKPAFDIGLAFVADEETGSEHGIQYLIENHDVFNKQDLIIVPDAGVPDGSMIEVAEKSIYWVKIESSTRRSAPSSRRKRRTTFPTSTLYRAMTFSMLTCGFSPRSSWKMFTRRFSAWQGRSRRSSA